MPPFLKQPQPGKKEKKPQQKGLHPTSSKGTPNPKKIGWTLSPPPPGPKTVYSNHHKGRLSETTPTKIARKRLHPTKGVSSNFIQRTPNLRTVGWTLLLQTLKLFPLWCRNSLCDDVRSRFEILQIVHEICEPEFCLLCVFLFCFRGRREGKGIMAFERNPLSLSLPQAAFEKWLRDSGYLEILDRCVLDHARIAGQGSLAALSKVIKINPFVNLTVEDLLQKPVSWTGEFFDCGLGPWETFSWPRTITQVKLRMEENVKRYTGNYLILVLIIFLCFL